MDDEIEQNGELGIEVVAIQVDCHALDNTGPVFRR